MPLPPPTSEPSEAPERVLERSLLHELTYHDPPRRGDIGFASLFERLHAGRPLRALAFGSSVTAVFGGCTASLVPNCPTCCGTTGYNPRGQATPAYGFLRRPVEWLNRTWPHVNHRLWNAAQPATSLEAWGDCLADWMPRPLDLVVLELGGARTGNTAAGMARLMRSVEQLLGRERPPAVLVVSFFRWSPPPPADVAPLATFRHGQSSDGIADNLARRYGWLVVSEERALVPETRTPPEWRANAVLWPSVKQSDGVHPSHGRGHAFYGSLVRHALFRAHEAWAALPRERRARLHAAAPGPLPELLSDAAGALGERRTAAGRGPNIATPANAFNRGVGACYRLDAAPRTDRWMPYLLPPLRRRDGWEFVQWENRSASPYKPGLLATAPGAVVELQVLPVRSSAATPGRDGEEEEEGGGEDAGQSAGGSSGGGGKGGGGRGHSGEGGGGERVWAQVEVALRHLVSYAHQGMARVSCVDGCACAAHVVDAHRPEHNESVQAEDAFAVQVAPPRRAAAQPRCTLRVEVLPTSRSGEHELKLYSISLKDAGS